MTTIATIRPASLSDIAARDRANELDRFAVQVAGEVANIGSSARDLTVDDVAARLFAGPDGAIDLHQLARGVVAALSLISRHCDDHAEDVCGVLGG